MAGGLVKVANKKFTTIQNDYCLQFSQYADIIEINAEMEEDFQNLTSFNFTTLKQLEE